MCILLLIITIHNLSRSLKIIINDEEKILAFQNQMQAGFLVLNSSLHQSAEDCVHSIHVGVAAVVLVVVVTVKCRLVKY